MTRFWVSFWLVCFLFIPAAQAEVFCEYDTQCAIGSVCQQGVCMDEIDARCGENDRRCRIELLKRRTRARRHYQVLREEKLVELELANEVEAEKKARPRLVHPIGVDYRVSTLSALGFAAGYTFAGRLRAELQYTFLESDIFESNISGFHEANLWTLQGVWFPTDGWAGFYLSGGVAIMSGTFSSFGGFGGLGGFGSVDLDTIHHAVSLGGGFDIQFEFGMHTRLGVDLRPSIYSQARVEPGVYDEQARDGLDEWWANDVFFDVVWLFGWAF